MQLPEERRKALAEMVARTPFMTLTRMAQKDAVSRSILYLPAYLHGDRIGGGVLMGSGFERDQEAIDVLHFSTQMLLAHLRLAEFPEETRSAETEVLQRLLIRRFRHNLQHPIGTLMDAVRRFHESYKQMMITLERGIDAWKPDLMPNYIVKFLNYVAAEYRLEGAEASDEGGDEAQEERQDKGVVRFPIDIKGTERIERFDRSILAEVLRNLFTNTGRYAARKGLQKVVLDADREGPVIDYREAGGTGLPPDIAADPWRLHSRDPEVDTSTGQGLFLAKKLMQVHGGDIEYDKDYREGCRFKIYLRKENRDGDEQSASGNRR
jgi:K+-sensing histidine kinase KdpD